MHKTKIFFLWILKHICTILYLGYSWKFIFKIFAKNESEFYFLDEPFQNLSQTFPILTNNSNFTIFLYPSAVSYNISIISSALKNFTMTLSSYEEIEEIPNLIISPQYFSNENFQINFYYLFCFQVLEFVFLLFH